ncbi:MAG: HTTM domain-containing protein [Minicystis sp.]
MSKARTDEDPSEETAATDEAAPAAEGEAAPAEKVATTDKDSAGEPSFGALLKDYYLTFDRRTLGFTRILLGFLLVTDLIHRTPSWMDFYGNEGVLPTHLNLFRPQAWGAYSIFNAFANPGELRVLWAVMMVTFVCLLVGYKTKLMQILSLIFMTGMNGRVLLIENGGYVVNNLLLLWTCFLPLGDRFSLDTLLASMKRRREASEAELNDRSDVLLPAQTAPHTTVLGAVLVIQIAAIYFFNVIHKKGPAWRNGTAVHYVIYVDRMVTPLVAAMRDYIPNWMFIFMTKTALAFEAGIPVAVLSPLGRVWARRIAIAMINTLHLAFGITFTLGTFAWSACVLSTLLFSRDDWEIAGETMRRAHRARTVVYDPKSPGALLVCRVLKRLDHFELLTFREGEPGPLGLAVQRDDEALVTRSAAWADIVEALPLGPTVAWLLRLPPKKQLADAFFAFIEARELSAWFGLTLAPSETLPGPSPLRMKGRRVLGVMREVGVLIMFIGAINQASVELWVIRDRIKVPQPEPTRLLAHKLRFLQGWFMVSPNPVMDDGTIVVDALTVDGRHIDPFTHKPPMFDLIHAKGLDLNQMWGDYYNRIHLPGNTGYREAMKDYMYRLPKRTGNPNDAIVSGEVYWVTDQNPKWGETESYKEERNKLFSFENPAVKLQAPPAAPPSGS